MPLSLNQRNPDLIARVDDAYERALVAQGELVSGVGGIALDALIQEDVAATREQGSGAGSGLEAVSNPDTRITFNETLAQSEHLFARLSLTTPTAAELAKSGVDFAALGALFEQMDADSLEPRLVLAPVLKPNKWQALYHNLTTDSRVNGGRRLKGEGLYIDDDVADAWTEISHLSDFVPRTITQPAGDSGVLWTLRLIPGTNHPTETNVSYSDTSYLHKPTVHEYLTLQARLLQNGQNPVDYNSQTWLNGTFEGGSQAPDGRWDPDVGQVGLFWNDVDDRDDALGVRIPVWESTNA